MRDAQAGQNKVQLIFYKVKPGCEFAVSEELALKCKEAGTKYHIFQVFGIFDLLLIVEHADGKSLLWMGPFKHTTASVVHDCFAWRRFNSEIETFSFDKLATPLLGLIFIKAGFQKLKECYKLITQLISDSDSMVLGSHGWTDAIRIIPDISINSLVDEIKKLIIKSQVPLLKTFSIIAINIGSCFEIYKENSDRIYPQLEELSRQIGEKLVPDSMHHVKAVVRVSCQTGTEKILHSACTTQFGGYVRMVMGKNELSVNVKEELEWPIFIKELMHFRSHYQDKIYATDVQIIDNMLDLSKIADMPATQVRDPFIPQTLPIDIYKEILPRNDVGRMIQHRIARLNQSLQNELTAIDAQALIPFADRLARSFIQFKGEGLHGLIHLLDTGLNQRVQGADVLGGDVPLAQNYRRGGIQKVLVAAETIPSSLLRAVGMNWNGYIVIGDAPDYKHVLEVINVPENVWLNPMEWWGIFHESGHAYALSKLTEKLQDMLLTSIIWPQNSGKIDRNSLGLSKSRTARLYLHEILADAFDHRFGFLCDTDLYLKTIWTYLTKGQTFPMAGDLLAEHLRRSICVLLIDKRITNETAKNGFAKRIEEKFEQNGEEVLEALKALKEKLTSWDILVPIDGECAAYVIDGTLKLGACLDILAGLLMHPNEWRAFQELEERRKSKELQDDVDAICNGYIIVDQIRFPHLIITELLSRRNKQEGFSFSAAAKTALLRTFWYQRDQNA